MVNEGTGESDTAPTPHGGEIAIDASQLRPGVHVRLPVGWIDHPFMFNSFVITDGTQVSQIRAMNLPTLFSDPARCDSPPLPRSEAPAAPTPEQLRERAELIEQMARQRDQKLARAKVVEAMRVRLDTTRAHYTAASQAVGKAIGSFDANAEDSVRQVTLVSTASTSVLMQDADSAIALISDKGHSDILHAHALSVMTLALLLGRHARLPEAALKEIGIAALLHDIGKIGLDHSLLRKPARSKFEDAIYQTHCRIGHDKAAATGFLSRPVLDAILCHHERSDGSGYPAGLTDKKIPLAARVIAIADHFDTLTNPTDPRRALSPSEALARMWSKERAGFDAVLLQLFVRAMGVYPPGSLVQLSDGRDGVVVASAATDAPLRPQVLVYEARVPRSHAIIVDLAGEPDLKIDRSLSARDRPADELDYLLPRRKMSWFHMPGH
ncbi:HD-GYP domain-containing protein [Ideonella sp. A 288]|uniref:HD-GYP domain-containing protein n=1 Tax=Ideonella sp. A 288 TaxID=1962181 RepID=UPI000B4B91C3|nr:HD-GYP domain-containing protein [Ideonella sp. A 288]